MHPGHQPLLKPMRYAALIALAAMLIFPACQSEAPSSTEYAERPDAVEARIDLELGTADGEAPYLFGRITGVAATDDHLFVADQQGHTIRAYALDGTYRFTVATAGEGPGEVQQPCCLTLGPNGQLWARDNGNRRYVQYRLMADRAEPQATIRMDHGHFRSAAVTFDPEDNLIDIGGGVEANGPRLGRARIHRSMTNETVRTVGIPEAPEGRVPMAEVPFNQGIMFIQQPMGPSLRDAHGPGGDWAFTITDRYDVTWFDAAGDTLHVLTRDVTGPELSEEERMSARRSLQERIDRMDVGLSDLPFGIPSRKPALTTIFFDTNGRLWVQRSVEDGAPNEADVYARDGTLAQVVQWPAGIDLSSGHLTADTLYGIRQGSDTFPQVVRLRY